MPRRVPWLLGAAVLLLAIGAFFWMMTSERDSNWLHRGDLGGARYEGPAHEAIFLLVVDTLRADRLSCYGYTEHQTPHLDRLAAAGVRFTEAHSVASWTRPSMAAILSSLYPSQLGLVEKPGAEDKRWKWRERREQVSHTLPQDETTVAEVLQDAGYTTAAFVNQPALNHQRGFQQGFDQWRYPQSADEVVLLDPSSKFTAQSWLSTQYADRADAALIDAFENWLSEQPDQDKLFGYVHLLTPHHPYLPKPPFEPKSETPSASELYDAEVRMVDAMLGRLLDIIDEYCEDRSTLIVFTSDHGEEFEDHGLEEHGHSLHREVVRVPLILRSTHLPAGTTVENTVRTVDIMPTILALNGMRQRGLMGSSLYPLLENSEIDLPVYSEAMLYGSTERSLIDGGYKLMFDEQGTHWRLFDLEQDPLETTNLAEIQPERVDALRSRLEEAHRRLSEDHLERLGRYESHLSPEEQAREAARAREALKALGYID